MRVVLAMCAVLATTRGAASPGFLAELGGHLAACAGDLRNDLAGCLQRRCTQVVRELAPSPSRHGDDTLARHLDAGDHLQQARKKKYKGFSSVLLMGLMMKAALGALALGGVTALAAKALAVGLMALTLAAALGLKKLASSGGGGDSKVELIAVPGHHQWRRLASQDGHEMAYSAHTAPATAASSSQP